MSHAVFEVNKQVGAQLTGVVTVEVFILKKEGTQAYGLFGNHNISMLTGY